MYKKGLFIFRRDLRITDNKGLLKASEMCESIIPIFIFTPEQVTEKNSYKSNNSVNFMIESLIDLKLQINNSNGKLITFYGSNTDILNYLIKDQDINCIFFNLDYTPYSIKRDTEIIELCKKNNISCITTHDQYLTPPDSILNGSGKPYEKFTPYYNKAKLTKVDKPEKYKKIKFINSVKVFKYTIGLEDAFNKFTKKNPYVQIHGGRNEALKKLELSVKSQKDYTNTRDILKNYTSMLSAYIKFGCISIREVYNSFLENTDFLRELYWRDFYGSIVYNFPYVIGNSQKEKYDKIVWKKSTKLFNLWCEGNTGFPVVDAGMRQLNTTGYMHNRCRMIVSSFLIKILHIDWRKGEKYFSQKLIDYDVASNNGGWQWSAGSGADSQQYNRIFNPFTQGYNYDQDCEYIKRWIPELKDVPNKDIHKWDTEYINYKNINYPSPIVDYKKEREKAIEIYTKALY
jgi:deoxyribodipyrimidine photo-lyase